MKWRSQFHAVGEHCARQRSTRLHLSMPLTFEAHSKFINGASLWDSLEIRLLTEWCVSSLLECLNLLKHSRHTAVCGTLVLTNRRRVTCFMLLCSKRSKSSGLCFWRHAVPDTAAFPLSKRIICWRLYFSNSSTTTWTGLIFDVFSDLLVAKVPYRHSLRLRGIGENSSSPSPPAHPRLGLSCAASLCSTLRRK